MLKRFRKPRPETKARTVRGLSLNLASRVAALIVLALNIPGSSGGGLALWVLLSAIVAISASLYVAMLLAVVTRWNPAPALADDSLVPGSQEGTKERQDC